MKTIKILKAENESLRRPLIGADGRELKYKAKEDQLRHKRLKRKNLKQIEINNLCIHAIEQGMTELKLLDQLTEMKHKLQHLEDNYETWLKTLLIHGKEAHAITI